MRTCTTASLLLLFGLAIATSRLPGQTIAGVAATSTISRARLDSAIARLQPRATIRAYSYGVLEEGKFTQTQHDTLWLSSSKSVMTGLPIRNVDSLWTRQRSTGRGAIIGGAAGAAVVSGFFFLLVNGLCESSNGCSDDYPLALAYGVAIGGSGGALVGAGIGTLVRHWQRRYP